ncbi:MULTISPECIES: hypothetical protein [Methylomicrobium]|nr:MULTISPECIES: hypothetical protein [Methylomicrobium]
MTSQPETEDEALGTSDRNPLSHLERVHRNEQAKALSFWPAMSRY